VPPSRVWPKLAQAGPHGLPWLATPAGYVVGLRNLHPPPAHALHRPCSAIPPSTSPCLACCIIAPLLLLALKTHLEEWRRGIVLPSGSTPEVAAVARKYIDASFSCFVCRSLTPSYIFHSFAHSLSDDLTSFSLTLSSHSA
jgi:hypothetical protein